MKKPAQILLFLAFCALQLHATDNYFAGARSVSLANAVVSVSDTWSTFHNQATLANCQSFSAGVFYESRYLIDELSQAAVSIVLPATLNGTLGFSFSQMGKGTFKESKIGLAYAKHLSEKINAALQFDYFTFRFPENDRSYGFPTFEAGVSYKTTQQLTLGFHVFNPIKNGIETYYGKEKTAAIFRFGGHYQFQDMLMIVFEIEKKTAFKPIVKSGLEFWPVKNLALRVGVSGKPVQLTSGIGYKFAKITTNIAFSYHGNLGFSPSVSVNYQL